MTTPSLSKVLTPKTTLHLRYADLTQLEVDAIVNAANSALQHGGGIAAIIQTKGGPVIQQESRAWVKAHGEVPHHKPALTNAGQLPCQKVIHAVGPIWGSGEENQKLTQAIHGSLALADEHDFRSIAFPAIATGIYKFPKQQAGQVIFQAYQNYFASHPHTNLHTVIQTVYDTPTAEAFTAAWRAIFQA